jgi:tRNA(His) 5'-end guanylyltransferase
MKQDASFFGEGRAELVYIAKRLKDALRLESIFTETGVDYGVEPDTYRGGIIFRSERVGAFFYVLPESVDLARRIMREHNYRPLDPEPRAGDQKLL